MVDRTSGVPAYLQVAGEIRKQIEAGELSPGAPLPSERELVTTIDVSRPTVRQAVQLLRTEGLVVAEHGRGIFVRPLARVTRLARSRLSRIERDQDRGAFLSDASAGEFEPHVSVRVRTEVADGRTARLLELEPDDEVLVRDRVMSANGLPVQLAVSRLPRTITQGTRLEDVNTGPGGAYARLEEAGHALEYFDEVVSARMPTSEERTSLRLPEGTPVVIVTRVAHTASRPVEVNDMVLAADKYELHYRLPAD